MKKHTFPSYQQIFFLSVYSNAAEHSNIHLNVLILHHEIDFTRKKFLGRGWGERTKHNNSFL